MFRPQKGGKFYVFVKIDFRDRTSLGPYRTALLERIATSSSIAEAARDGGLSYRKALRMVRTMNTIFREPLVVTKRGRKGGATLTPFGRRVVSVFRAAEREAVQAARKHAKQLDSLHAPYK